MSPTVFRDGKRRFYFNSREETRMHVHVQAPDGEAKFWLEPIVALEQAWGMKPAALRELQSTVEERKDEIIRAWKAHFRDLG